MNNTAAKTMLITGAGSGIGSAVAKLMYTQGWHLGLLDVTAEPLQALVSGWDASRYEVLVADVTDATLLEQAIAGYAGRMGRLDVLFNCAGILAIGDFEAIPLARHQQILDINNGGVLNCCYIAFPYLRDTAGARVINMSSASSLFGTPGFASYSASKFWVKGFTEALNVEWARYDIAVMDIEPPFVKTPMLQDQESPIIAKLGVNLTADDIAQQVLQAATVTTSMHQPVGLQFQALRLASRFLPNVVSRNMMKFLADY